MRLLILFTFALIARFAVAQQTAVNPPPPDSSLNERLDALEREVRDLKAAAPVSVAAPPTEPAPASLSAPAVALPPLPPPVLILDPDFSFTSLGPVASKVYASKDTAPVFGVSAEFFSFARTADTSRSNVTSFLPTLGLRLHPRLIFNSQLLVENGGAEARDTIGVQKGQAVIQMAYLDWLYADNQQLGVRLGHHLVPVGEINTLNEPTTYFSVMRPEIEREIIPSSWHENGLLFWVNRPRASLEAGIFNSLNSAGLRKETFLAGGRSQGQLAPSDDFMGVFRIHAKLEHALIGGSVAFGNTAQDSSAIRSGAFQLSEIHIRLHWPRFQLAAIGATGQIQDADGISIMNSTVFPEQARGNSAEAAADLLGGDSKLWLFGRYSHLNLHDRVPQGYSPDPELDKTYWTSGLAYYPLKTLVLKADYQRLKTPAASKPSDSFDLGVALLY